MNLTRFLKEVENILDTMSSQQLMAFIHDMARTLPENQRNSFLNELEKIGVKEEGYKAEKGEENKKIQEQLNRLKENLTKIEEGVLCLEGSLNEMYDEWYNDDEDEFLFEDPEGVTDIIVEACGFLHKCIDMEEYEVGYEIGNILVDLSIEVDGEYMDYMGEPLFIEDLELFHLCSIDHKKLVVETMYAAYRANELSKRSEILYEILKRSERNDVTMEMIMQCSEELPEFDEFLERWIQYLGKQSSVNVERLLKEALEFVNNENKLLEFARENYVQHPGFYEQYISNNVHYVDKKSHLLEIGKEALGKIEKNYLVRSRIALLTSQVALDLGMQKEAENGWLEAFRSDTRVVNYLRLFVECVHFSDYMDEVKQIRQNIHLKNNRFPYTAIEELKENQISDNEFYMLAFLGGEFSYAKEQGMNVKDSLGWSVTFMKCGLAAFLLLLLENENLQQGCKEMCCKIVSEVKFDKNEYENGLIKEIDDNSQEWFWNCLCRWKNTIVLSEEEKNMYMQWIEKLVEKRVKGIMEANRRNYYGECAAFIAALGEVRESRGEGNGKQNLLLEYKTLYSRRRAFHQELRTYGMIEKKRK